MAEKNFNFQISQYGGEGEFKGPGQLCDKQALQHLFPHLISQQYPMHPNIFLTTLSDQHIRNESDNRNSTIKIVF